MVGYLVFPTTVAVLNDFDFGVVVGFWIDKILLLHKTQLPIILQLQLQLRHLIKGIISTIQYILTTPSPTYILKIIRSEICIELLIELITNCLHLNKGFVFFAWGVVDLFVFYFAQEDDVVAEREVEENFLSWIGR